eukprot:Skav213259  [mRNA]  locus=scaffold1311:268059:271357:+ [translate_table: standard]
MHPGESEVQELTFAFSRFEISVQIRVRDAGAGPDFELVTGAEPSTAGHRISAELENQVLAANSPGEYAALNLDFLSHLERRLTGSDPIWTPKARIGRAFKAGLVAKHLLSGGRLRCWCRATMASPTSMMLTPLTRAAVEAAAAAVDTSKALSLKPAWLHLRTEELEDGTQQKVIAVCYLLRSRAGGFMIVAMDREDVRHEIEHGGGLTSLHAEAAVFQGTVELVTSQRRKLGSTTCLLVDLPWARVEGFFQPVTLRGRANKDFLVEQFEIEDRTGRPTADSAMQLSEVWLTGELDVETAEEYATGGIRMDGLPMDPEEVESSAQARVLELERELAALRSQNRPKPALLPPAHPSNAPPPQGRLFTSQTAALTDPEWSRLQLMAGSPPPRVNSGEPRLRPGLQAPQATYADQMLAEFEKGAAQEIPELTNVADVQDPIQKLLLTQMQQNTLLMQRLLQPRESMASFQQGLGVHIGVPMRQESR